MKFKMFCQNTEYQLCVGGHYKIQLSCLGNKPYEELYMNMLTNTSFPGVLPFDAGKKYEIEIKEILPEEPYKLLQFC